METIQGFDLETYLSEGVEHFVKGAMKATLQNPRESLFLARYARSANQAAVRRHALEQQGVHAPSFLIASVTQSCNLRCAGCYAQAGADCAEAEQMSADAWEDVFT